MGHFLLGGPSVRYKSLAQMLVVRTGETSEAYVKGIGKLLPRDADPNHLEELLELGLIEEVSD